MRKFAILIISAFFLLSCSTVTNIQNTKLEKDKKIVILPLKNNTETIYAGKRVASIIRNVLQTKGYDVVYIETKDDENIDIDRYKELAKSNGDYILIGEVNEFRYKTGIDGEPAVNISLNLIDLKSDKVVWSAVGSKTGWGHESITTIGQKLINELFRNF